MSAEWRDLLWALTLNMSGMVLCGLSVSSSPVGLFVFKQECPALRNLCVQTALTVWLTAAPSLESTVKWWETKIFCHFPFSTMESGGITEVQLTANNLYGAILCGWFLTYPTLLKTRSQIKNKQTNKKKPVALCPFLCPVFPSRAVCLCK